ncbi:entericidin A/B family lipoprotein [Neisseriaceae bacterium ESL0693]|nr:entericidin A/B family lipoprotein [Neisseriaceae bacterium ESL0693]
MTKLLMISTVLLAFLSGCHTVSGVGQDIKGGGHAVSHAADKVHSEM